MALTHVRGSGSLTHTSKNRKCLHFSSKSSPSPQNKNVTVSGWVSSGKPHPRVGPGSHCWCSRPRNHRPRQVVLGASTQSLPLVLQSVRLEESRPKHLVTFSTTSPLFSLDLPLPSAPC